MGVKESYQSRQSHHADEKQKDFAVHFNRWTRIRWEWSEWQNRFKASVIYVTMTEHWCEWCNALYKGLDYPSINLIKCSDRHLLTSELLGSCLHLVWHLAPFPIHGQFSNFECSLYESVAIKTITVTKLDWKKWLSKLKLSFRLVQWKWNWMQYLCADFICRKFRLLVS